MSKIKINRLKKQINRKVKNMDSNSDNITKNNPIFKELFINLSDK